MLLGLLAKRELDIIYQAAVARVARKAESNVIIQKRDIIYSHKARSKITARKKIDVKKTQKTLD